MALNMARELAYLRRMTPAELRVKYAEVFGETSRSGNREHLIKRIAWRIQANDEGGLSERARRRAEELANDFDARLTAPKPRDGVPTARQTLPLSRPIPTDDRLPMPGTILTRQYRGETLQVSVLADGFEFEGEVYGSLTAIAKKITGSHWNGFHFFGLQRKGGHE